MKLVRGEDCYSFGLKISRRIFFFSRTQDEGKKEFQFKVELMMEFDLRWRLLEYVSNS